MVHTLGLLRLFLLAILVCGLIAGLIIVPAALAPLSVSTAKAAVGPPDGPGNPGKKKGGISQKLPAGNAERTPPRLSDTDGDGDPDKMTFLEFLPGHGWSQIEVLDDDDDMRWSDKTGDRDSDAWVVDYGLNRSRDRMVDYVDNDGDGDGDEMAIYHYKKGLLVWAWLVEDLDDDNKMWELSAYEYQGATDQWRSDFSGNNSFSLHKYDQSTESWLPFSENPFLFYDLNGDGYSEEAIRFVTLHDDGLDANDPETLWSPLYRRDLTPEDFRIASIRFSWDLDGDAGKGNAYDYDFGFTRVGSLTFPGYLHHNKGHRYGGVWPHIPWQIGGALARTYPALASGFVWDEMDASNRWEGVIWHNGRRKLSNAGGPAYPHNFRYEWDGNRSEEMKVYWHPADRRIHMLGADEGWMSVDWDADGKADYRLTFWDLNRNGIFDGWSVDLGSNGTNELWTRGGEEGVETLPLEYESLSERYREELGQAIRADLNFINFAAARGVRSPALSLLTQKVSLPAGPEQRRFYLDLLKDLYYVYLSADLRLAASGTLDPAVREYRLAQLRLADEAYGRGDLGQASDHFRNVGKVLVSNTPRLDALGVYPNPFSPNGDGINDSAVFSYKLTRDATVTISIAGGKGVVASVLSRQWRAGGLSREVWKGKGWKGRKLPAGNYRYTVIAKNNFGSSTYEGMIRLTSGKEAGK